MVAKRFRHVEPQILHLAAAEGNQFHVMNIILHLEWLIKLFLLYYLS